MAAGEKRGGWKKRGVGCDRGGGTGGRKGVYRLWQGRREMSGRKIA